MATDFSEPEPLVMEIVYLKTSKLNEVLHQIIERGLDIDGQHYIFYTSTTNQMKRGESILLKEDFYKEHEQEITQGLKSDEVPIIAQAGEAVVTEKQIENLAEAIDYIPVYQEILDKISEVANAGKMDEVAKMIPKAKYDTPKPKEVTQNNQTINVTQDINVNCPNVTNTTGAEYLVKALRKASADVLVYNK